RRPRITMLGQTASVSTVWALAVFFALIDAATTWYALRFVGLQEGNPVAKWAIAEFGLSRAVALRVLVGAGVLGIVAVGTYAHPPAALPRPREPVVPRDPAGRPRAVGRGGSVEHAPDRGGDGALASGLTARGQRHMSRAATAAS